MLPAVVMVSALPGRVLHLVFENGTSGEVDVSELLDGPIFESIREDEETFRMVRVDEESGTVVWENGADLAPEVLYMRVLGQI